MTLIRPENRLLDVQFGIIIDVELSCDCQSEARAARTVIGRTQRGFGPNSHRLPAGSARRAFSRVEREFAQLKRILRLARHGLAAISAWIRPEVAQARLPPPAASSVSQKSSWTRQPLVVWWIAIHHP
jgi:hypothetical protein